MQHPRTLTLLAFLVLMQGEARADEAMRGARADLPARLADPDTAYGRVAGDVGVVLGVGASLGGSQPRGAAELRLRYLDTAGAFVTYEDAFAGANADLGRVLAMGFELRPLFLGRWVTGNELGLAWPDLVIDSLGFEIGAFFAQPPQLGFGSRVGLQAGLGLELPLGAHASGFWVGIHGGARWSDDSVGEPPSLFLAVTIAYHQIFATHLVDPNDRAPR